jgi:hypothetical protein
VKVDLSVLPAQILRIDPTLFNEGLDVRETLAQSCDLVGIEGGALDQESLIAKTFDLGGTQQVSSGLSSVSPAPVD